MGQDQWWIQVFALFKTLHIKCPVCIFFVLKPRIVHNTRLFFVKTSIHAASALSTTFWIVQIPQMQ
jgi:hypothetical protein